MKYVQVGRPDGLPVPKIVFVKAGEQRGGQKKSTGTLNNLAEAALLTNPMPSKKDRLFRLKIWQPFLLLKVRRQTCAFQIFLMFWRCFSAQYLFS